MLFWINGELRQDDSFIRHVGRDQMDATRLSQGNRAAQGFAINGSDDAATRWNRHRRDLGVKEGAEHVLERGHIHRLSEQPTPWTGMRHRRTVEAKQFCKVGRPQACPLSSGFHTTLPGSFGAYSKHKHGDQGIAHATWVTYVRYRR